MRPSTYGGCERVGCHGRRLLRLLLRRGDVGNVEERDREVDLGLGEAGSSVRALRNSAAPSAKRYCSSSATPRLLARKAASRSLASFARRGAARHGATAARPARRRSGRFEGARLGLISSSPAAAVPTAGGVRRGPGTSSVRTRVRPAGCGPRRSTWPLGQATSTASTPARRAQAKGQGQLALRGVAGARLHRPPTASPPGPGLP